MKCKKIITHDGLFHADEVMAIALVHEMFTGIPVERTRTISTDDMLNFDVWIIDVGGKYDPYFKLFDHHHDADLPASCVLILNYLWMNDVISIELYNELNSAFDVISEIDKGSPAIFNGFQFNSLIKSFNSLDNGFQLSLDVCSNYIKCAIDSVNKTEQSQIIWNNGKIVSEKIMVCDAFPIHWKRYDTDIQYLIYPNSGKCNLLSKDSVLYPIKATGEEEFIHNAKFLAVFSSKEKAIDCALTSVLMQNLKPKS